MAEAADNFLEAQQQSNLLVFRDKTENGTAGKCGSTAGKSPTRCFVCDKTGHRAADCRARTRQPYCDYCHKTGHDINAYTRKQNVTKKASCILSPEEKAEVVNDIPVDKQEENMASAVNMQPKSEKHPMPALQGIIFGQAASVLRDTGSNTMVVRRSLVPDEALTGTTTALFLADGSRITVPEAKVEIFLPYFSGMCIVKCMSSPLYDIIVGNVPGSRAADDADKKWKEKLAEGNFNLNGVAETLYTKKEDHRLKASLGSMKYTRVRPDSAAISVSSLKMNMRELEIAQAEDKTLEGCKNKVGEVFYGR
ncbi:uncharacterized protein LOC125757762 [Rhipicephalus sanguineus]|uniref:uncharacterized protein LOC125757762 n=1 Tax=Rhipicephalus sanguineus TaxID=34632 RepID=UPI0020C2E450|nr:uncharacterized protein LOC125757762 [Rhipicephalus sanguineus]